MPRHTLDKWTYSLKTMNVCITQHKEEDIYNHMVKMFSRMQELYEKYKTKFDSILKEIDVDDKNMYNPKKYNWRQGEPSRFWLKNADLWFWVDVPEIDKENVMNEYFTIYQIFCDFTICDKYTDSWENEKPDWDDMFYEVKKMQNFMKESTATIKLYENASFIENKAKWEMIDHEWIQENNKKKEHKKHPVIELPSVTNYELIPNPYPAEPLRNDCSYCKLHWEEMKPRYDRAVEIWTKNKQSYDEWKQQQELEDQRIKEQQEKRQKEYEDLVINIPAKNLHCDLCDYQAKHKFDLESHNETEKHKQKTRYCNICNLQCRNDADYTHHIETVKHKKNAGLIEKVKIFKCNHCDYQTTVKCNYEKHIVSKNHM